MTCKRRAVFINSRLTGPLAPERKPRAQRYEFPQDEDSVSPAPPRGAVSDDNNSLGGHAARVQARRLLEAEDQNTGGPPCGKLQAHPGQPRGEQWWWCSPLLTLFARASSPRGNWLGGGGIFTACRVPLLQRWMPRVLLSCHGKVLNNIPILVPACNSLYSVAIVLLQPGSTNSPAVSWPVHLLEGDRRDVNPSVYVTVYNFLTVSWCPALRKMSAAANGAAIESGRKPGGGEGGGVFSPKNL